MPAERPPDASRFLFVASDPALDFVNTLPMVDGRPHDLLGSYDDLVDWLEHSGMLEPAAAARARQAWHGSRAAARIVDAARTLRTAIREAVVLRQRGRSVPTGLLDTLNAHLRTDCERTAIVADAGRLRLDRRYEPAGVEDLLVPVARAAAVLLCDKDASLVKQCAGAQCVLFFYDETKNHARRWCSMRICGNRAKAAAHYQRLQTQKPRRR